MVGFVQVCLFADEKKSPGNYSIPFNAKDHPVGIYHYRIQTET